VIDWEQAKVLTRATTASVFDTDACRLLPMVAPAGGRDGNARRQADPDRPQFDFFGKLDLEPSQDAIPRHLGADPGSDSKMVAYDVVITAHTGAWPYLPARFDRIAVGPVTYQIMLGRRDGGPRMAFYCNRVK
jgi:hypothetical protein